MLLSCPVFFTTRIFVLGDLIAVAIDLNGGIWSVLA